MSVEALEEAGVEPIMTRATAERLEWVTALGVKSHFGGKVPERYTEAIDAMEELAAQSGKSPQRRTK